VWSNLKPYRSSLTGDIHEIARDLISIVVLKASISIESFDESRGKLFDWIFSISKNAVRDYLKKVFIRVETSDIEGYDAGYESEENNSCPEDENTPRVKYVSRYEHPDSFDSYVSDIQDGPDAEDEEQERRDLVRKILDKYFEQRDRDLYNYLAQGMPAEEIAERFCITINNLYSRKYHLIRRLRNHIRTAA